MLTSKSAGFITEVDSASTGPTRTLVSDENVISELAKDYSSYMLSSLRRTQVFRRDLAKETQLNSLISQVRRKEEALRQLTDTLEQLREEQRRKLLDDWYRPHHAALTLATEKALQQFGLAVIIDCHSFPAKPLPYEIDQNPTRPEICIGTDAFHTHEGLTTIFVDAFAAEGWTVGLNAPFSGAMVPSRYFGLDKRVAALMIEVRRDVYMEEGTGASSPSFEQVSMRIRNAILHSLSVWQETTGD